MDEFLKQRSLITRLKKTWLNLGKASNCKTLPALMGPSSASTLHGNYVHGNKVGMGAWNNNSVNTVTNSNSISIQSNADRFDENGIGIFLNAGLNQGTTTTANENFLHFEAHGTSIQNNMAHHHPMFLIQSTWWDLCSWRS